MSGLIRTGLAASVFFCIAQGSRAADEETGSWRSNKPWRPSAEVAGEQTQPGALVPVTEISK